MKAQLHFFYNALFVIATYALSGASIFAGIVVIALWIDSHYFRSSWTTSTIIPVSALDGELQTHAVVIERGQVRILSDTSYYDMSLPPQQMSYSKFKRGTREVGAMNDRWEYRVGHRRVQEYGGYTQSIEVLGIESVSLDWPGTRRGLTSGRGRWQRSSQLALPFWLTLVLVASGVVATLRTLRPRRIRRLRAMNNQCLECGYDLRASTSLCPECGK